MRVSVDTHRCCGSGQCVLAVPDVFDQREEDGIVRLLEQRPPAELHAEVRTAATVCPSGAIEVHEA
ncbi:MULTISPECIES: ferredoxin [Streptomyces]|uniref:Ferredoxin n=1 Tax=Streptomyces silvisoli TaxID=3034235 RepID=A0ABT5ZQ54_9ACTN|nr:MULTISPECIES: ferredoxin [Streptomyces]MDF3291786.1 ferredoxin [Streptomyces silvisoli]